MKMHIDKLRNENKRLLKALKLCSYQLQTWAELDSWSVNDEKAYTQAEKVIKSVETKKQPT